MYVSRMFTYSVRCAFRQSLVSRESLAANVPANVVA
jgi:hypothetical protein